MTGANIVFFWSFVMFIFFLFLAHYVFISWANMTIARKLKFSDPWMAWVPILNWYLLVKISEKPGWWAIFYLIPMVRFVINIIVFMRIAVRRDKPEWLALLFLMPFGVWIVPGILAWAD